jgi:hypothetical protein
MQEKNTNIPNEKKPGEGQQFPETGKQGGQGDIGKKGGDTGGDLGRGGQHETGKTGDVGKDVGKKGQ